MCANDQNYLLIQIPISILRAGVAGQPISVVYFMSSKFHYYCYKHANISMYPPTH